MSTKSPKSQFGKTSSSETALFDNLRQVTDMLGFVEKLFTVWQNQMPALYTEHFADLTSFFSEDIDIILSQKSWQSKYRLGSDGDKVDSAILQEKQLLALTAEKMTNVKEQSEKMQDELSRLSSVTAPVLRGLSAVRDVIEGFKNQTSPVTPKLEP